MTTFTAFGEKLRTKSQRPYVLVAGPRAAYIHSYGSGVWEEPAVGAQIIGYVETLKKAEERRKRVQPHTIRREVRIVDLTTGEEF